jgi:hypothetical protein
MECTNFAGRNQLNDEEEFSTFEFFPNTTIEINNEVPSFKHLNNFFFYLIDRYFLVVEFL